MNRVSIVTGGANGIGRGIVWRLATEGDRVVIFDIDDTNIDDTLSGFHQEGFDVAFYKVDLLDDKQIEDAIAKVYQRYGRIDTLVNDAGLQIRDWAMEFDMEQFDRLMGVNVRSYYLCARTAARYMKEQESGGTIVCISSVNSHRYHSKRSPYNISKAAVNGLVGTLAVEWGRFNIRINAVAPGYVETEIMMSGIRDGILNEKNIMSVIPMKKYVRVEEVANVVWFLASGQSSGVTGQVIFIDCGQSKIALPEEKEM